MLKSQSAYFRAHLRFCIENQTFHYRFFTAEYLKFYITSQNNSGVCLSV